LWDSTLHADGLDQSWLRNAVSDVADRPVPSDAGSGHGKPAALMADIFISYASVDRPVARRLADALEVRGWSVWWDHRSLHSGQHFDRVIEEAICGVRPVFDAFADSHGRLVHRRVFVCPETAALKALDTWSELRTVLAVETIRSVNGSGTVEAEIRYFLSSCRDEPTGLVQAIRRH